MRNVSKISLANSYDTDIKERNIHLPKPNAIQMNNMEFLDSEKSEIKFIKKCESFIRSSLEYKELLSFLKEEADMKQCSFFSSVTREDASIEIHHAPFTLYDIVSVIFNFKKLSGEIFNIFDISNEVMKVHFQGIVGLIPLSKTIHELAHTGDIFIPNTYVYGNYNRFYTTYKIAFSDELEDKYKESIKISNAYDNEKSLAIIERKFTYLNIDGVEYPKPFILEEKKETIA